MTGETRVIKGRDRVAKGRPPCETSFLSPAKARTHDSPDISSRISTNISGAIADTDRIPLIGSNDAPLGGEIR
jgi:hypothetical protein